MRYIILRKKNSQTAKQFKIVAPVITIGRTSDNSIAIKDGMISRQHCAIETSNNVTRIRDLGSFHGFLLNDKQTREAVLKHGDCITLGMFELYYIIKDDSDETTADGEIIVNQDAAPTETVTQNGEATEGMDAQADVDVMGELDLSAADALHIPESRLRGSRHPVLEPDEKARGEAPLNVELASGDFPIETDEPAIAEADDMDLNALVVDSSPPPPPPPVSPVDAPSAPAPISPPPPPPAQRATPDPRIAEGEAHIKQLQHEFGVVLKQFEANKAQLAKTLEALENEQLKSSTVEKKYKRAIEKIAEFEGQLAKTTEKLTQIQTENAQHLKEYHELDERLHAAEQMRDETKQQHLVMEANLENVESAKADLEKQAVKMQKANDGLDAQVKQYQAQYSTARKKMATLETNLNTVQESRMRAKNLAATLEKERNDLQGQLDETMQDRNTHETRTIALESELSEAIHGQSAAEGKIVEAQKATLSRSEKMHELEAQLSAANETIKDLEDELEDVKGEIEAKLSSSQSSPGAIDMKDERVKRKLVAMEKERRKAVALAEQAQKKLASAHQQATVLQSFLDEREALITKLRKKLRQAGGDEDTQGD